jgi:hypothetical protein
VFAEQRQVVGDVGCVTPRPANECVDEERQADAFQFLDEDVILKFPREGHQIIKSDRTS